MGRQLCRGWIERRRRQRRQKSAAAAVSGAAAMAFNAVFGVLLLVEEAFGD